MHRFLERLHPEDRDTVNQGSDEGAGNRRELRKGISDHPAGWPGALDRLPWPRRV